MSESTGQKNQRTDTRCVVDTVRLSHVVPVGKAASVLTIEWEGARKVNV